MQLMQRGYTLVELLIAILIALISIPVIILLVKLFFFLIHILS